MHGSNLNYIVQGDWNGGIGENLVEKTGGSCGEDRRQNIYIPESRRAKTKRSCINKKYPNLNNRMAMHVNKIKPKLY
jgi:hypothetical protein